MKQYKIIFIYGRPEQTKHLKHLNKKHGYNRIDNLQK